MTFPDEPLLGASQPEQAVRPFLNFTNVNLEPTQEKDRELFLPSMPSSPYPAYPFSGGKLGVVGGNVTIEARSDAVPGSAGERSDASEYVWEEESF